VFLERVVDAEGGFFFQQTDAGGDTGRLSSLSRLSAMCSVARDVASSSKLVAIIGAAAAAATVDDPVKLAIVARSFTR
jgi:hypothetical protein